VVVSTIAFFAVAQDGHVVDAGLHRLRMPLLHEATARLRHSGARLGELIRVAADPLFDVAT
jgi:hypothetical protein